MGKRILLTMALAAGLVGSAVAGDYTIPSGTVHDNSQNCLESGTTIYVEDGGAFDLKTMSNSDWYNYNYRVYLKGGTGPDGLGALRDTGTVDPRWDDVQVGRLELWAPSLIKSSHNITVVQPGFGDSRVQTWEHTLTLDFAADKSLMLANCNPWDAVGTTKVICGGMTFLAPWNNCGNNFEQATFSIEGEDSWLKLEGSSYVIVNNLLMSNGAKLLGTGRIVLNSADCGVAKGTFRPAETNSAFAGTLCFWGDGNIDLSGLTDAWTFPPAYSSWNGSAITVTVKPGDWAMSGVTDHKIIAWTTEPGTDLTFVQDPSTRYRDWEFDRRADGLYLRYIGGVPYYALRDVNAGKWRINDMNWTELTGEGVPTEPTSDIIVIFSTQAEFDALKALTFTAKKVLMRGIWTLTADKSFEGLDFALDTTATIDAAGHHLTLPGSSVGSKANGGAIKSTVAGGILELTVPEGGNETLTKVTISGGNKIVLWKSGKGRLAMENENSGIGVANAVSCIVKEGELGRTPTLRQNCFGPAYSTVKVEDGGRVDLRNNKCWDYDYQIVGDGPDGKGALSATEPEANWGFLVTTDYDHGYLRHLTLNGDASVDALPGKPWPLSFWSNIDHNLTFNGHTFTVGLTEFVYWINLRPTDAGTLIVGNVEVFGRKRESGQDESYGAAIDMGKVDVEVRSSLVANAGCFFNPIKSLKFEPNAEWRHSSAPEGGYYVQTTVYDAYRPALGDMPAVQLGEAGHLTPTLDLSTQTNTLNGARLSFASGSTVTVEVGTRELVQDMVLVSWPQKPANVMFKVSSQRGTRYRLEARSTGLVAVTGLAVILR